MRSFFSPRPILSLGLLLLASSCAAGGAVTGSGSPTRLTLRDYRVNLDVELVNDAFTDRLEYYSTARTQGQTGRKFQTDEVIDAMLENLDDEGWDTYAQAGSAPRDGASVISSAFELERDGKVMHWKIGNGSDVAMRRAFIECKKNFMLLYQETAGFQAVKDTDSGTAFRQPSFGDRSKQGSSFR